MPPSWEERASLFCAYLLIVENRKSTTLRSYISAIKAKLVADDYPWDGKLILLNAITKTCKSKNDVYKTRLPISKYLLEYILFKVERIFVAEFTILLYQTAFLIAYYGLLRVGEITDSQHVIKAKNVLVGKNKDKLLIVLYSSKTHSKAN